MRISFRQYQVIAVISLLASFGLTHYVLRPIVDPNAPYLAIILADLLIGAFTAVPFLMFLKTRVRGYEQKTFFQIVIAGNPTTKSQVVRSSNFFNEPKVNKAIPASVGKRIVAYLVDVAIVIIYVLLVGFGSALIIGILDAFANGEPLSEWILFWIIMAALIPPMGYLFIRDGFNGQSIGKRLVHIQVVDMSTLKPIGAGYSAGRYLCLRILGLVELFIVLIQPNHRRLGDWLTGSIVIEKPRVL